MTRKFVVGIDEETPEDVSSFLNYIKQQRFGWWHWIDNTWLLTTYNEQVTVVEIRDRLREITGKKTVVVIEVKSVAWATYGPMGEGDSKNISRWIRDYWSKP